VAARARRGLEQLCVDHGSALLVTSHNMTDVERMCERVVFLSKGRIVADGSPSEVAAKFGLSDLEQVFLHLAAEDWD
jgi:ABC-2 type transport system ATP-binding protein